MVTKVGLENFKSEVVDSVEPVLLDFYLPTCGPCRIMMPVLERFSEGHKVAKINVDAEPELAQHFEIQSVPTLLLVSKG